GMRLFELLSAGAVGLVARDGNGKRCGFIGSSPVRAMGLADDESLLAYDLRSFQGYRLLHEYFALPQRFLFIELSQLSAAVRNCSTTELELIVLLDRRDATVEAVVSAEHLALFCTPVANLFPKKTDRIHLSEREN